MAPRKQNGTERFLRKICVVPVMLTSTRNYAPVTKASHYFTNARQDIDTRRFLPRIHATLMYIWPTSAAPGSVIASPHAGRVQMIVVSGQPGDAGQWQTLQRNIVQDYEKVSHEPPGRITGYGLLTDTDNTGTTTRAWHGDIQFLPGP